MPKIVTHHQPCHEGIILVAKGPACELFAAGKSRLGPYWLSDWPGPDILLGPADVSFPVPQISVHGPLADALNLPTITEPTTIGLPWPDFESPAIPDEFWHSLATAIESLAASEGRPIKLLCYCQGGHGRTGTALAIMSGLLNLPPAEKAESASDIINAIRACYCQNAVESFIQAQYIGDILGLPLGPFEPPVKTTPSQAQAHGPSHYLDEWLY